MQIEPSLLPSDPLGRAVRYYLRQFEALTLFIGDPSLPTDNNRSERVFQNHAQLRLNALFAGSQDGAHRWAIILGVVETAQRLGLDVFAYLCRAFERRGTWRSHFAMSGGQLTPAANKNGLEQAGADKVAA